jgi:hypothetical protein
MRAETGEARRPGFWFDDKGWWGSTDSENFGILFGHTSSFHLWFNRAIWG